MAQNIHMRFYTRTTANNGNCLFNFIGTKFRFNQHTHTQRYLQTHTSKPYAYTHQINKIRKKITPICAAIVVDRGRGGAIEENVWLWFMKESANGKKWIIISGFFGLVLNQRDFLICCYSHLLNVDIVIIYYIKLPPLVHACVSFLSSLHKIVIVIVIISR